MANTDWVVLVFLVFNGLTGWRKGLLRSLLGPVTLGVSILAAVLYYQKTHNIFISFVISLLGPFVLKFLVLILLHLVRTDSPGKRDSASFLDRVLGAGFNLLWGGAMAGLIVLLLALMPVEFVGFGKVKEDVLRSRSFVFVSRLAQAYFPKQFPRAGQNNIAGQSTGALARAASVFSDPRMQALLADPEAMRLLKEGDKKKLQENKAYQAVVQDPKLMERMKEISPAMESSAVEKDSTYEAVMEDKRVQDLVTDPEVSRLIQEKNYLQLLKNEKFQKVLQDPALIGKLLDLQRKMGIPLTVPTQGQGAAP